MLRPGLAGVVWSGRGQTEFPKRSENAQGNNLPPVTGDFGAPFRRGPAPGRYMGSGGQLGAYDGYLGDDPRFPQRNPQPWFLPGSDPAGMDSGTANNPGAWRGGLQGFNDKLTVKDRHAYYDTGNQTTGIQGFPPSGSPNTYNDPKHYPPRPDLRTVNRTVSYQKGSDKTAFQDDLTRDYKPAPGTRGFIGEQGSGWIRINGGVHGLYQPYGTRGGVPYAIVSPVAEGTAGDGPGLVFAGPPHGLHTQTPWKGGAQIISRAAVQPQMRPVRIDRPSNSPQAGQSFSQTVRPQGSSAFRPGARGGQEPFPVQGRGGQKWGAGRGWSGTQGRSGI